MLRKFASAVKSLGRIGHFDPATLADPEARRADWTPLKRGGANFGTHRLVDRHAGRLEFRPTVGARIFYSIFLLMGAGIPSVIIFSAIRAQQAALTPAIIFPLFIGTVFVLVGGAMLYHGTAPIVFDQRKGFFWKGRKAPDEVFDRSRIKHYAEIDEIRALQLLSEYVSGSKSSYYSYEMNLVLKNGARINVVDHGDPKRIRADAEKISQTLGIPVWDGIS